MIKYAAALGIFLLVIAAGTWAFLPSKYLPGNRARHMRLRLHLRLHPGKGFATLAGLHLRWGRIAALRGGRRGSKTTRFLALTEQQHGPLSQIPLTSVAPISARLSPQVGLDPGAARTALRRAVIAAQNIRSTP